EQSLAVATPHARPTRRGDGDSGALTFGTALGREPDEVVRRGLDQDRELATHGRLDALQRPAPREDQQLAALDSEVERGG
ncbi:4-alpha-glucanotransferase, partial [Klebsiella pneumoniae]|nr:4-alpha-glucanotransferase [Klebsiella pneumoniae]